MTNEKLDKLNLLQRKISTKKNNLNALEKYGDESSMHISGYGKVCDLTPIEAQMIKTRLQMELQELEKEFESL